MVRRMSFNVGCVKKFLEDVGVVYSVRSYEIRESSKVVVDGVGVCERRFVREFRGLEDIKGVSGWSGFDSVEEWLEVILRIYVGNVGMGKFLYRVEKIGGRCDE